MPLLNSSDWIALSSAVVALSALVATIWQGLVTRRHSRLSVRPHIDISTLASHVAASSITLKNGGLGPALLDRIELHGEGNTYVLRGREDFEPVLLPLSASIGVDEFAYNWPDKHTVISPGESWLLLSVYSSGQNVQLAEVFLEHFGRFELVVHYRCLYGDRHVSTLPRQVAA